MSNSGAITSSAAGAYKRHIRKAATSGDWVKASSYDITQPNWVSTFLTEDKDTALHIAVSMEQTSFVEKLVQCMSMQDMEIINADGTTAFCMAAISGNVEIATILLRKNPRLVWIRDHKNMLPIQLASRAAKPHMVEFLFERTREDMHINLSLQDINKMFFLALTYNIYTVALILLDIYPELASKENEKGLTALEVLAQVSFDKDDPGYQDILSSLFKLMEEEDFPKPARTSKAMFDAAKLGNIIILEFILEYNPNLLMKINSKGQSLLHIAILYRQVSVYQLILSKGAYKKAIMLEVDYEGNNILHFAGKLSADVKFGSPINQVLIRNEELWYKEVEKMVPPELKTMRNTEGLTPQQLFHKEHEELIEKALSELNEIANNFLLVATLVVTLGITGALTIRTNNIEGQTPFFQQKIWYLIFLLSIAVGISLSAVSMLFFTSAILRSIWKQSGGFVGSRLIRITFGFVLLCFSMGIMGAISTTSGAVLIYYFFPKWVFYVIAALGGIPVVLSYLIYGFSLPFSLYIFLAICDQAGVRILSRKGIKWAFYIG